MGITQRKGDIAVAQAVATFTRLGFLVSCPLTESAPYDLVVDLNGQLYRAQIKYTSGDIVHLLRVHSNSRGYVVKEYPEDSYDWLYVLKADGREYLIKSFLTSHYVTPMEDERIERWQEPSPRGRLTPSNGERNHFAKLDSEQVLEIRHLYSEGVSQRELARRFHVNHATIGAIIHRKSWEHI